VGATSASQPGDGPDVDTAADGGGLVRIEPLGQVIDVKPGEDLFTAAQHAGLRWPTVCNGKGQCTVCLVRISGGFENAQPPRRHEVERLTNSGRNDPAIRLACRLYVSGPVTVIKRGVRPRRVAGGASSG
jgi:2Fe-2S ferredoxin